MIDPDESVPAPGPAAPLEAIYDEATLARLNRFGPARRGSRPAASPGSDGGNPARADRPWGRTRASTLALALAGAMVGVGEAIEPQEGHVVEAEVDPGWWAFSDRRVQFLPVWGNPRASRVLVRRGPVAS